MDGLTVLNPQSLTRKATRQLIGVDGHTAYLLSHARKRKVRGKRTIRNFITTPIGNTCTDLAIETDGSVFSLQNLKLSRKYHRRIFQQLLALRVEEGREAEYLKCRRCVCGGPCTLCDPPTPLMYTSSSRDEEEEEEDYDDEEEEEQPVRRKNKKRQRSRWPR
ncbi:uncharacterized protein LOC121861587 [Homarus americanus]|uniref:uncharacterized protein LOC121861587 n=1 Tax=Homarus americanus TaxID=6706 RepID=UPI001C4942BA|nr:uncharacterized protein LOC121861587 [Homarus americanus]